MHKRTNLVLALLDSGVSVFIGETDQVWQVDPIHHVQKNFQGNICFAFIPEHPVVTSDLVLDVYRHGYNCHG